MNNNIEDKIVFTPGYKKPQNSAGSAFYFIFHEQNIILKNNDNEAVIPYHNSLDEFNLNENEVFYFGHLNNVPCYTIFLDDKIELTDSYISTNLRSVYSDLSEDLFWIAGHAFHQGHWNRTSKFCGRCATELELKKDETAKVCPACHLIVYPRISPAVIMAVVNDGKILLAHNNRWNKPMFSTLAGFVEVGESLEECVKREVKEETGIDVKNIKYFGSQPWHFTGSLMIGFTAEYAGGELKLDESELQDGGWYSPDDLPPVIARKPSIARQLIDWFVKKHS